MENRPREFSDSFEQAKENIQTEFLQPFDDAVEIESPWLELNEKRESSRVPTEFMLQKNVGDYQYNVYLHHVGEGRYLEFQLKDSDNNKLAELGFNESLNEPGVWNLDHRLVRTQAVGVNGTMFLRKAEEYLAVLKVKQLAQVDKVIAQSTQPKVTEWFLTNGYEINDPGSQEVFRQYQEQPEQFELVEVDHLDKVDKKDLFLFTKEAVHEIPDNAVQSIDDSGLRRVVMARSDMYKLPGFKIIKLEKKIE